MVLNVNHCPVWVFDVVACVVAREFLQSPLSLDSVSSKFQKGMAANYDSIEPVHLVTAAEQVLITLSEANAGEADHCGEEKFDRPRHHVGPIR